MFTIVHSCKHEALPLTAFPHNGTVVMPMNTLRCASILHSTPAIHNCTYRGWTVVTGREPLFTKTCVDVLVLFFLVLNQIFVFWVLKSLTIEMFEYWVFHCMAQITQLTLHTCIHIHVLWCDLWKHQDHLQQKCSHYTCIWILQEQVLLLMSWKHLLSDICN